MTTNVTLPGHENCDYTRFELSGINLAVDAIDEWLDNMELVIPAAVAEFDHLLNNQTPESKEVQVAGRLLLALLKDVDTVTATRECLMCEIMNRAYADLAAREN